MYDQSQFGKLALFFVNLHFYMIHCRYIETFSTCHFNKEAIYVFLKNIRSRYINTVTSDVLVWWPISDMWITGLFAVFEHQNKSTCARQNFFRFYQSIVIHIISQFQAKRFMLQFLWCWFLFWLAYRRANNAIIKLLQELTFVVWKLTSYLQVQLNIFVKFSPRENDHVYSVLLIYGKRKVWHNIYLRTFGQSRCMSTAAIFSEIISTL